MRSYNRKISIVFMLPLLVLTIMFSSCVSYSTLQTPETLEPGHINFGVGSVMNLDTLLWKGELSISPEVSGRIGISKGYDIGFKYTHPGIYMMDLKHQFKTTKINVAIDMGVSVANMSIFDSDFDVFTLAVYPTILLGKKFWYIGAKGTIGIYNLNIIDDQLILFPYISGPIIITGLKIGNEHLKLLLELNTNFSGGGVITVLPAVGLYYGF